MSTAFGFRLNRWDRIWTCGRTYLFDLSNELSAEQRRRFINAYRGYSESSAFYALSHARLWSKGVVTPKPESIHRYVEAIRSVLLNDQRRELLTIECEAYYEELTLAEYHFSSFDEVANFVIAGTSDPATIAPRFDGYSCSLFTPAQIQEKITAAVRAKMQIVSDSLREVVLLNEYSNVLSCVQTTMGELIVKHAASGIAIRWSFAKNSYKGIERLISVLDPSPIHTSSLHSDTLTNVAMHDGILHLNKSCILFGVAQLLDEACKIHEVNRGSETVVSIADSRMSLHYHSHATPLSELRSDKRASRFCSLALTAYLIWLTPSAYWLLTYVAAIAWIVSLRYWAWTSDREHEATSFIRRLLAAKELLPSNPPGNYASNQGQS